MGSYDSYMLYDSKLKLDPRKHDSSSAKASMAITNESAELSSGAR